MSTREIRTKLRAAERARREKQSELMKEYDENVYRPAIQAIQEECAKLGHAAATFHDNGLGWKFYDCSACRANIKKECYWPTAEEEE